MLVLATSTPVTVVRERASKSTKTGKTSKDGKNNKSSDENLRTKLIQVFYIKYAITF